MKNQNTNPAETKSVLLATAAESTDLQGSVGGPVTDVVAGWLAPLYLVAAQRKMASKQGAEGWEVLRLPVKDWALLRRGDHSAARLQLEREKLAWLRDNSKLEKEKQFEEWAQRPENRERFEGGLSAATFDAFERELNIL